MPLDLELLRHGQASGQGPGAALTETGFRQIDRLAARLAALGWKPDRVFASPYQRAQQTARRLLEEAGLARDLGTLPELLPEAEPEDLAAALIALEAREGSVLVVAHLPLLGRFAHWCTQEETSFSPATLVRIRFPVGLLEAGRGHRVLRIGPEDLAAD